MIHLVKQTLSSSLVLRHAGNAQVPVQHYPGLLRSKKTSLDYIPTIISSYRDPVFGDETNGTREPKRVETGTPHCNEFNQMALILSTSYAVFLMGKLLRNGATRYFSRGFAANHTAPAANTVRNLHPFPLVP